MVSAGNPGNCILSPLLSTGTLSGYHHIYSGRGGVGRTRGGARSRVENGSGGGGVGTRGGARSRVENGSVRVLLENLKFIPNCKLLIYNSVI